MPNAYVATIQNPVNGSMETADPILAAIARRRAARIASNVACVATDPIAAKQDERRVTPADRTAFKLASRELDDADIALAETVPTTVAGWRAVLAYAVETAERGKVPASLVESILESDLFAVA